MMRMAGAGLEGTIQVRIAATAQRDAELRASMLGVDAELRAGGVGGSLLAESFANVLAVHLIRHITGRRERKTSADGVLPRPKLRLVAEAHHGKSRRHSDAGANGGDRPSQPCFISHGNSGGHRVGAAPICARAPR